MAKETKKGQNQGWRLKDKPRLLPGDKGQVRSHGWQSSFFAGHGSIGGSKAQTKRKKERIEVDS